MSSLNNGEFNSPQEKSNITQQVLDEAAIKQAIEENQPKKSGIIRTVFFDFGRKTHWSSARKGFLPHLSNVMSMLSPNCPMCGKSILMHDNRIPFKFKGNVVWFCGSPICDYEIIAPNSFNLLKKQIANTHYVIAQERLAMFSEAEKLALISSHFFKSKLYLLLSLLAVVYTIYMTFMAQYKFLVLPGYLFVFLFVIYSIRWAYRAWQIRTGMLFLPNSPFLAWFRYAPSRYNLDWYDGKNPLPKDVLDRLSENKKHFLKDTNKDS
ncbi:TPA: hypothetical protein MW242_003458 [Acinetobacter baumannii]|nr:hypothetical protein [Acinetobacter baumannii]